MEHWIIGLMRENSDALGFIPSSTVEDRYIRLGRYVLQHDERGNKVGYLLHGTIVYGHPLCITQHCIQSERRLYGYGEAAFSSLLSRAIAIGASSIHLRCATDLPSLHFWHSQGFEIVRTVEGGKRRNRTIAEMALPLSLPLFDLTSENRTKEKS